MKNFNPVQIIFLAVALWSPRHAVAATNPALLRQEDNLAWAVSAASRCNPVDKDGRWLEGTCVQLVTKVAGTLIKTFVPQSADIVKDLLEIIRCQRGPKTAGSTAPYLAGCVERRGTEAARHLAEWMQLRAKAPGVPDEVPDAPMPKGDGSLFPDR